MFVYRQVKICVWAKTSQEHIFVQMSVLTNYTTNVLKVSWTVVAWQNIVYWMWYKEVKLSHASEIVELAVSLWVTGSVCGCQWKERGRFVTWVKSVDSKFRISPKPKQHMLVHLNWTKNKFLESIVIVKNLAYC